MNVERQWETVHTRFRIREGKDKVIFVRRLLHSLTGLYERLCNRNMDWKLSLLRAFVVFHFMVGSD